MTWLSHSAPLGEGKRCATDGAAQVILGIAVAAGELRTGQTKDGLNLNSGSSQREQMSGNPKIYDAPIRLREAFANAPPLHTPLINHDGLRGVGRFRVGGRPVDRRRRGRLLYRFSDE